MQVWEIATIRSAKQVVLHLHEFPAEKITARYLFDKIGVSADVIFTELGTEDNFGFLGEVYSKKFKDWEGVLRRPTSGASSEDVELQPMPKKFAGAPGEAGSFHDILEDGAEWHNDPFEFWELPRGDIVLPFDSGMRCELFNLTLEQSEANKCVAPPPYSHPNGVIQALRTATTELRNEAEGRAIRWADNRRYISAFHRIDAVLRLQSRNWAARIDTPGAPAAVGFLTRARKDVSAAIEKASEQLNGAETAAAEEVLGFLRESSLRTAAEQLAFDPTTLRGSEAKDLSLALGDAAEALSESGHAYDFTREHVVPTLKEACRHPSYGLALAVEATKDPVLRHELDVGWQATLGALEDEVGIFKGSPYEPLVTAAKLYKGGTGIVASMLSPGTFAPLWNALEDFGTKSASARLGGVLTRWLITSTRTSSTNANFVGFGGRLNYKAFADELEVMRRLTGTARLNAQLEVLREAQVDRAFLRSRAGLSLNWLVGIITLLAAMDSSDDEASLEYAATIAAGVAGLTSTAVKTVEYLAVIKKATRVSGSSYKIARLSGRLATVFGAVATYQALQRNLDDPSLGSVVPEYLQLGSSALSAAGWGISTVVDQIVTLQHLSKITTRLMIGGGF
jgi:hypothetical protein